MMDGTEETTVSAIDFESLADSQLRTLASTAWAELDRRRREQSATVIAGKAITEYDGQYGWEDEGEACFVLSALTAAGWRIVRTDPKVDQPVIIVDEWHG